MLQLAHVVQTALTLPAAALSDLQRKHYAVIPNFVPPALVSSLVKDVALLHEQKCFELAEVGEDDSAQIEDSYRRCEHCYLYPDAAAALLDGHGDPAARQKLIATLDGVREQLSVLKPIVASRTEGLYVCYPNGGFYRRHRDAAPKGLGYSAEARAFSYLLYLNEGWQKEHGGCLRLFTGGAGGHEGLDGPDGQDVGHASSSFVDVEPRAGTLVVFRSDEIVHEVLDTFARRLVVAGWWHSDTRGARLRRVLSRLRAAVSN